MESESEKRPDACRSTSIRAGAINFVNMKLVLALLAGASALELTPENWDEKTAGKTVFVKFLAPW